MTQLQENLIVQVKCQTKTDLSTSRTLQSMHEAGELADPADGWHFRMWEGDITTVHTKTGVQKVTHHKRPYLINEHTLAMITVQSKAWMDSPACVMWAEL